MEQQRTDSSKINKGIIGQLGTSGGVQGREAQGLCGCVVLRCGCAAVRKQPAGAATYNSLGLAYMWQHRQAVYSLPHTKAAAHKRDSTQQLHQCEPHLPGPRLPLTHHLRHL